VIQATPQTELAQTPHSAQHVQEHEAGIFSKEKPKTGKNGLGVFAKILSGLTNRGVRGTAGAVNVAVGSANSGALGEATEIPLAEFEPGDKPVSNSKAKNIRAGKAVSAALAKSYTKKREAKPSTTGEIEPELIIS
jgi:hypothetical protein